MLELFDFQGSKEEQEELILYVMELSKLPKGKELLSKLKDSPIRKPVPLSYIKYDKDFPFDAQFHPDTESLSLSKQNRLPKEPKEKYWDLLWRNVPLLGHEITHAIVNLKRDGTIAQKVYIDLLDEAIAYLSTSQLRYEFFQRHVLDLSFYDNWEQLKNTPGPDAQFRRDFLSNFIRNTIPDNGFKNGTPVHYIDSRLFLEDEGSQSFRSMGNQQFLKKLSKSIEPLLGTIQLPSFEECQWYFCKDNGEYSIFGNLQMMSFDRYNAPQNYYLGNRTRVFSQQREIKEGRLIPKRKVDVEGKDRPLLEEEVEKVRELLTKKNSVFGTEVVDSKKRFPKKIETWLEFCIWQEQQKKLPKINKNRGEQKD